MSAFEYILPAIRGIQAGREYYALMFPLRLIAKFFPLEAEKLPPELRAQRILNTARVPQMARYVLDNPDDYTFSAITATVDAAVVFEALGEGTEQQQIGRLRVPMEARFALTDGQHRRAALERALQEKPELGYESIAVVLFVDLGLARSQQMFTDLNRFSVHPPPSLNILYDRRDACATVTRAVVEQVSVFRELTELERSQVAKRSPNLFSLNGIYSGTKALLSDRDDSLELQIELAVKFWRAICQQIPEWEEVWRAEVDAATVRQESIHSHAIALIGLGRAGAVLISIYPDDWEKRLEGLKNVDWSRSHPDWEGRVIFNGRIAKTQQSEGFISAYLKRKLTLPLTPAEEQLEQIRRTAGYE